MNLIEREFKWRRFATADLLPCDSREDAFADRYQKGISAANGSTVFLVDGDHSVRGQFVGLISSKGYRVMSFGSAEEFLQEEMNTTPACLVTEVRLPGLDGPGLQNLLRRKKVLLPIVFMAEQADIRIAIRVLESGAVTFLLKPVDESALIAEIENALAVWHGEARQYPRFGHDCDWLKGFVGLGECR